MVIHQKCLIVMIGWHVLADNVRTSSQRAAHLGKLPVAASMAIIVNDNNEFTWQYQRLDGNANYRAIGGG